MNACDAVAERVALGEPLGELAEHAASCAACRRVAAVPAAVAGAVTREADPGAGFTARMTAGAQQRFVARRWRRVAGGLAAAVVVVAIGAFAVTHTPDHAAEQTAQPAMTPPHAPEAPHAIDPDVATLVRLARYARAEKSHHLDAHWARIEKPLAPYRAVLRGAAP